MIEKALLQDAHLGSDASSFGAQVLDHKFPGQVAYLLSTNQKALRQQLESCVPWWYDCKAIWHQFPAVADSISIPAVEEAMGAEHEVTLIWPGMKFDPLVQSIALKLTGLPLVV